MMTLDTPMANDLSFSLTELQWDNQMINKNITNVLYGEFKYGNIRKDFTDDNMF